MTQKMISIPISAYNDTGRWQLDLFWFNHKLTYKDAHLRAKAGIVMRNMPNDPRYENMEWPLDIPHVKCESMYDCLPHDQALVNAPGLAISLNTPVALAQVLATLDDDELVEVIDFDMFHFRKAPPMEIGDDELFVWDDCENWFLKSLTENRNVLAAYLNKDAGPYNGGYVPIIGKVKTLKKIMYDWISVDIAIVKESWPDLIRWWSTMYAFQVACANANIKMTTKNFCFVPDANKFSNTHYIAHYSVDPKFNKKAFPNINLGSFDKNIYYTRILQWFVAYFGDQNAT